MTEMLEGMSQKRVQLGVPRVAKGDLRGAVVDASLKALTTEIRPQVSVIVGPPGSATRALSEKVAAKAGGCAVDVDELLDKELERETEIGILMHNMLAKGQVIPISITLQLLKNVCSYGCQHIILENFPWNVDEIRYIKDEFVVDQCS